MGPGEVAWWEVAGEDNLQTIRLYCDRLDARQDSTSGHPQLSPSLKSRFTLTPSSLTLTLTLTPTLTLT